MVVFREQTKRSSWLFALIFAIGGLAAGVALVSSLGPAAAQTGGATFNQLGQDIDGEATGDESGTSVAMSADGNTVVIGSPEGETFSFGHARVFRLNGGNWVQLGQTIVGDTAFDDSAFAVDISADGNTVAIGAPNNDDAGDNAGQVLVFRLTGGSWVQLGQDIDGETARDFFGSSVAMSDDGNTVIAGAPLNDGNGSLAGHARIFRLSGNSWVQLGQDIDGETGGDFSGTSVAMSSNGNTVAVGAPNNQGVANSAGHVRIFRLAGGSWVQLGQDIDGIGFIADSGEAVAISANGNTVAIGAPQQSDNGDFSGQVRVFQLNGNTWNQLGTDIDGDSADDEAGSSVGMSADGNTIIIGAPENDDNGTNSGQARIFQLNGNTWNQLGTDIDGEASSDLSGTSVAMSADGSTVVIGSPFNDSSGGVQSGQARVYRNSQAPATCNGLAVTVDIGAGDTPTPGADVILGTPGGDTIAAGNGNDTICGEGGPDTITGGSGNDTIFGGDGSDTISGQAGNDVLHGEAGGDRLNGGVGSDQIFGGTGNDDLRGQGGNDTLNGENGTDQFFGGSGQDTINTGNGGNAGTAQVVSGQSGADTIFGSPQNDVLDGGLGQDEIHGGAGNDILNGGRSGDDLFGDAGNDQLFGGPDRDTLSGGAGGNDTCDGGGANTDTADNTCETTTLVP